MAGSARAPTIGLLVTVQQPSPEKERVCERFGDNPLPRPTSLRETPLGQWHAAHGGRMVDFAGWTMPVQYASIVDEHLATRSSVGLFDVSHMGRLSVTGPGALDWLESMLTRKVAGIVPGQFRYTLVTADAPAPVVILDDALVSRDSDAADGTPRMGLVINAGNRERVVAWLRSRLPATGVDLVDHTLDTAMIAVQGPKGSISSPGSRPRGMERGSGPWGTTGGRRPRWPGMPPPSAAPGTPARTASR